MIASLHGWLKALGGEWAIVDVNGIGFRVYMPTSSLSTLSTGREIHVYTHLHLREDSATLYGFISEEELGLFETLITASGIGPRLALAMLSAMNVEQIIAAIATGSVNLLITVPGIGRKTAERLILELKDKIGAGLVAVTTAQTAHENADVVAALTSLGYSTSEASRAIASLPASSDTSLEEKIKLALQYFSRK